jgi:hypothetical protein
MLLKDFARNYSLPRNNFADDAMTGVRLPELADMKPVCTNRRKTNMEIRNRRLLSRGGQG